MRRSWPVGAVMLAAAMAAGAAPSAALAQGDARARMRPEDAARLAQWRDEVQNIYINLNPGNFTGISPLTVRQMLDRQPAALNAAALPGTWRCRNVQFSMTGAFGYPPFQCRIRATPDGLFFEKISGSQRLSGMLLPDDAQSLVLLAGATVNQEPQRRYLGDGNDNDVVGRLTQTGRNQLMLIVTGRHGPQLYELTR